MATTNDSTTTTTCNRCGCEGTRANMDGDSLDASGAIVGEAALTGLVAIVSGVCDDCATAPCEDCGADCDVWSDRPDYCSTCSRVICQTCWRDAGLRCVPCDGPRVEVETDSPVGPRVTGPRSHGSEATREAQRAAVSAAAERAGYSVDWTSEILTADSAIYALIPLGYAHIGTDGRDPVVWAVGETEEAAEAERARWTSESPDPVNTHEVRATAAALEAVRAGEVAVDLRTANVQRAIKRGSSGDDDVIDALNHDDVLDVVGGNLVVRDAGEVRS